MTTPVGDFLRERGERKHLPARPRDNRPPSPSPPPTHSVLTPLSQELRGVSVDEVHGLDDHGVNNTGEEQEGPGPEGGLPLVDRDGPTLHPEVDHHDVEGQVEAEQDEGQGHQVDAQLPLGVGVEGLLAARHRVQAQDAVEARPGLFKGLLPAQRAPAVG